MQKAGIVCTAKHFPGHGSAAEDSHGTLPEIDTTMSVLWERELLPYRFLIRRDLPAVMSGHLSFPAIEEEGVPASLSSFFLEEILRGRLGFDGIIITDDMRMHAVQDNDHDAPMACMQAFEAGNDVIMVSRDPEMYERIWDLFHEELQESDAFRNRLIDSVRRILRVKYSYLHGEDAVPIFPRPSSAENEVPSEEAKSFFFNQACRSASVIRNGRLPIGGEGENMLIAGQLRTFLRVGKQYYPRADTYYFPYTPFYESSPSVRKRIRSLAGRYDTILFCLANPNSAQVLDQLEDSGAEVVVLSTLTPVYLAERGWVETAVAVYGTGEDSAVAGFATLRGMIKPGGRVPVPLEPFAGNREAP
jgi:beta-N-acetylhexosaminidase